MAKEEEFSTTTILLIAIAAVFILFNQIQLFQLSSTFGTPILPSFKGTSARLSLGDLKNVDLDKITSTPQAT